MFLRKRSSRPLEGLCGGVAASLWRTGPHGAKCRSRSPFVGTWQPAWSSRSRSTWSSHPGKADLERDSAWGSGDPPSSNDSRDSAHHSDGDDLEEDRSHENHRGDGSMVMRCPTGDECPRAVDPRTRARSRGGEGGRQRPLRPARAHFAGDKRELTSRGASSDPRIALLPPCASPCPAGPCGVSLRHEQSGPDLRQGALLACSVASCSAGDGAEDGRAGGDREI